MRRHQPKLAKRQRGAVAVVVGLTIFVLVGMIGLALDSGQLFVNKTELQNAADACALAAARELDGTADALSRGDAAGDTVAKRNLVGFQENWDDRIALSISYNEHLSPNDAYLDSADAEPDKAKFVMCEITRSGIGMWFMGGRGCGDHMGAAYAVATLSPAQTSCAVPIGLCSEVDGGSFEVGKWYGGKFKGGSSTEDGEYTFTGSYNWIDFTVQNGWEPEDKQCVTGSGGGGADEIKCLLSGPGQCELPPVDTLVGQQGQIGSASEAWNTRFGLYLGSPNIMKTLSDSPPDFIGTAYTKVGVGPATETTWPSGENAYSGPSGTIFSYQDGKAASETYDRRYDTSLNPAGINGIGSYKSATTEQLIAYGSQRRVALAPIVECKDLGGTNPQPVKIQGYACVLMLSPIKEPADVVLEYLGPDNDPNSPCSSFGLAGGTSGPLVPVLVQ
jgi:hypothetical protein